MKTMSIGFTKNGFGLQIIHHFPVCLREVSIVYLAYIYARLNAP